jgi:rhomboid protease GluP
VSEEPHTEARAREPDEDDEDSQRGFRGAPVTAALFATNVGVFAGQVVLAGDARYAALGIPSRILRWLGANASLWTIADDRFETLVTSVFLHASLLHLGLNLWMLWNIGRYVERSVGAARYFPLYLASGVVASAASAIWGRFFEPATLSVGASGALCGLVGAAIVIGVRLEGWKSELTRRMTGYLLVLVLGIPLLHWVRGDIAQIDNAAHVGGALGGAIVAMSWDKGYEYSRRATTAITAACVALVAMSGVAVYVRDRTDPFVFMDVDQRVNAAYEALAAHRCDRARSAIARAMQMDPQHNQIRAFAAEIARQCAEPPSLSSAVVPSSSARGR